MGNFEVGNIYPTYCGRERKLLNIRFTPYERIRGKLRLKMYLHMTLEGLINCLSTTMYT
jgi:hypothetical protein